MSQLLDDDLVEKDFNGQSANFNRAKLFHKYILYLMGFSFLVSVLTGGIKYQREAIATIIGIPVIFAFFMSPVGLFFLILSYSKREAPEKKKFGYLFSFIFFNVLFLAFIVGMATVVLDKFQ